MLSPRSTFFSYGALKKVNKAVVFEVLVYQKNFPLGTMHEAGVVPLFIFFFNLLANTPRLPLACKKLLRVLYKENAISQTTYFPKYQLHLQKKRYIGSSQIMKKLYSCLPPSCHGDSCCARASSPNRPLYPIGIRNHHREYPVLFGVLRSCGCAPTAVRDICLW